MIFRTCLICVASLVILALGGCNTSTDQNLVKGDQRQGVSDRYIIGTPSGDPAQPANPAAD